MNDAAQPSPALEFLDHCATEQDIEKLIVLFRAAIATFGFRYSACGCWFGAGANRTTRFFFIDWPEGAQEWYLRENLLARDPLVFAARRRMAPFTFGEVYEQEPLQPEMVNVYAEVREFGILDGFAVPIHGPAGYQGLVSLLATSKLNLTPLDRSLLEIMCRTLHDRCRTTVGFGAVEKALPKMSIRELECMKWVAAGKTNWEIGQLLGISKSTVHFHVESVKKKLNKNSRTEAVAILVLHGLI